eukprot:5661018-Lingulodinium_polyedra.AAC.1
MPRTHHARANIWCSHGVRAAYDLRAVAEVDGRFDRVIVHGFKTVCNGAVESIGCRRSGSQIARFARTMRSHG